MEPESKTVESETEKTSSHASTEGTPEPGAVQDSQAGTQVDRPPVAHELGRELETLASGLIKSIETLQTELFAKVDSLSARVDGLEKALSNEESSDS